MSNSSIFPRSWTNQGAIPSRPGSIKLQQTVLLRAHFGHLAPFENNKHIKFVLCSVIRTEYNFFSYSYFYVK